MESCETWLFNLTQQWHASSKSRGEEVTSRGGAWERESGVVIIEDGLTCEHRVKLGVSDEMKLRKLLDEYEIENMPTQLQVAFI